jgi:hypothetical protein
MFFQITCCNCIAKAEQSVGNLPDKYHIELK